MIRDELGGTRLAIGQLGMLMDVAAPRYDLALDLGRAPIDFGAKSVRLHIETESGVRLRFETESGR